MQWGAGRNCNTHGKKGRRESHVWHDTSKRWTCHHSCKIRPIHSSMGLKNTWGKARVGPVLQSSAADSRHSGSSNEPDWGLCTVGVYMWVPWNKTTKHHSFQTMLLSQDDSSCFFFPFDETKKSCRVCSTNTVAKRRTDSSTHWQALCTFFLSSHTSLSINLISDLQMSLQCSNSPEYTINTVLLSGVHLHHLGWSVRN